MTDLKIPAGHHRLNPYFLVHEPEGFMSFLKEVFGATEKEVHRNEDGRMMHAEYRIGDSALMFGESSDQWRASTSMNYLYVADTDATHKAAMAAGCTELYAPRDEEYGVRGAGVKDRWGNTWWLAQPL